MVIGPLKQDPAAGVLYRMLREAHPLAESNFIKLRTIHEN